MLVLKCISSCKCLINKWKCSTGLNQLNISHLNPLLLNLNVRVSVIRMLVLSPILLCLSYDLVSLTR